MESLSWLFVLAFALPLVSAVSVTEIQGPAWLSPYNGQTVQNVTGVVTTKLSTGFYITGEPSSDIRESNGLYVYSTSTKVLGSIAVGDYISLGGKVSEYRSSSYPTYLFATELTSPTNITVISQNNTLPVVVLGVDRSPPTQQLSSLDKGFDGILSVPNNQTTISATNETLLPDSYGMDFWSSLEGQLVTVKSPVATGFENNYGEFWVRGDWKVTGLNGRGGLTITFGPDGLPDANPEAIIVGSPVDGTKNPKVALGKTFADITGVIQYQFGFYYILPLTSPKVIASPDPTILATTLVTSSDACTLVVGDYNVENMNPKSSHIPTVANHIANYLLSPDIVFLQEIQDNSGETDDGVVDANATLTTLSAAITLAGGYNYNWTQINPQNDQDGGVPGGNIRPAYLYKSSKVSLVQGSPVGGSLDATAPVRGADGKVTLSFNPGRIDPMNTAWNSTRKPLVAAWQTTSGKRFFTIDIHDSSKGGSSSTQGDQRPPINGVIDARTAQVKVIAKFVISLLKLDPLASIIVSGDFNEYSQTRSVFAPFTGILWEVDLLANISPVERYTYVYDQNSQQLDHMFVSPAMALRKVEAQHIHVNTWAASLSARVSDHDPSVARVRVC